MSETLLDMSAVIIRRVYELMSKFEEKYAVSCKHDFNHPVIKFTKKGVVAGTSSFNYDKGNGTLNFNPIIMRDNWKEFDQTVVHEVSHYCVSLYCGSLISKNGRRVSHGTSWKNMMYFFGKNPSRCHGYDVSRAKTRSQRQWRYECGCQVHLLSTTMHNKIRKGSNRVCMSCNISVKYIG